MAQLKIALFATLLFFLPDTILAQDPPTTTPPATEAPIPSAQEASQTASPAPQVATHENDISPTEFGYDLFGSLTLGSAQAGLRPIPANYPLGPGDQIDVHIWGPLEFNETLTVNQEGYIAFTKLNHRVNLNGVKFAELEPLLLRELSKFYAGVLSGQNLESKKVELEVKLTKIRGINLFVLGEVQKSGAQYLSSASADLMYVLSQAGGIKRSGSLRNIQINHPTAKPDIVDLYDLMIRGKQDVRNLFLQEGDMVFVPLKQKTVRIAGQVRRPSLYEIVKNETLKDVLDLAGGPTPRADLTRVQIVRQRPNNPRELLDIDLTQSDAQLFDGDQITVGAVPTDWREDIVEITGGGVRKTGRYRYAEGLTLSELITRAGGLYDDALTDRADVVRTRRNQSKELIQLNLSEAMRMGFALQALDRVITYSEHAMEGGDKSVTITGQVKNPGQYTLAEGMTLYDLLFAAGGVEDPDYRKTIHLDRADIVRVDSIASKRQVIPVDLRALLDRAESVQVPLESQDQIVIYAASDFEEIHYISIQGAVRKPGAYRLFDGMSLQDLLVRAGGLKETAEQGAIEVSRTNPDLITSTGTQAETFKVAPQEARNFPLAFGDLVLVRENPEWRPKAIVAISGEIVYPGQYVLENETEPLSQLITRAGGLLQTAFPEGMQFYRSTQRVSVDLPRILSGNDAYDLILVNGDSIHIPTQNLTVAVQGAVINPSLVQWKSGAKSGYYIRSAGGLTASGDKSNIRIRRANGFSLDATRKFWFDPSVPPGSTIIVPEKPPKTETDSDAKSSRRRPPAPGPG